MKALARCEKVSRPVLIGTVFKSGRDCAPPIHFRYSQLLKLAYGGIELYNQAGFTRMFWNRITEIGINFPNDAGCGRDGIIRFCFNFQKTSNVPDNSC